MPLMGQARRQLNVTMTDTALKMRHGADAHREANMLIDNDIRISILYGCPKRAVRD